jgi:hypothetical protein
MTTSRPQADQEWCAEFFEKVTGLLNSCRLCGGVVDRRHRERHARFHGLREIPVKPIHKNRTKGTE